MLGAALPYIGQFRAGSPSYGMTLPPAARAGSRC